MPGLILGFKVQTFKMFPLGFLVSFKIDTKNYNKKILKANLLVIKKIVVAIAGPMTNLILIIILMKINNTEILNISIEDMIYSNILIFIFNMLPIYPLDGGRALKNILHVFYGKLESMKITYKLSNITAFVLSLIGIYIIVRFQNLVYLFAIMYIWILLIKENKVIKTRIIMYECIKNKE